MHDDQPRRGHPLRVGSLFSGYGGLDLAVEYATGGETIWFSEINTPATRVFAHHWPDAPNLGDISTVEWTTVPCVDVLIGGFPCQDVSTVGKGAASHPAPAPGSGRTWRPRSTCCTPRSSSSMTSAACSPHPQSAQPWKEQRPMRATRRCNRRACNRRSQPGTRPVAAGRRANSTSSGARSRSRGSGRPPAKCAMDRPTGVHWPAHRITGSGSSSPPTAKTLFRTPLASDSSRGGETLDQVRARRGTIALSHQVIDLALHGPHGSPAGWNESETLFALIEDIFTAGGDTPRPSPDGSTSPDGPPPLPRS